MQTADYIKLEDELGAHNYKPLDVVLTKGEGVWVWDVDGKKYLDCLAAYSAVNQGHCHPEIMKTMMAQAGNLTLTSRAFRNDQLGHFYKEICELTRSHKVLPMNSGAEAVETVIKAVRKWSYQVKGIPEDRAEIIVCADPLSAKAWERLGRRWFPTFSGVIMIEAGKQLWRGRRDSARIVLSVLLGTVTMEAPT